MFSDVAKVFSRDFAIGYFLPATFFVSGVTGLALLFPQVSSVGLVVNLSQIPEAWTLSSLLLVTWLLALLLLVGNYWLIRLLEGYGLLDRTPLLRLGQWRFAQLERELARLEERYRAEEHQGQVSEATQRKWDRRWRYRRCYFPARQSQVLPTEFGNVVRAFETYIHTVYAADAIPVWPRLFALIPDSYRDVIGDAKAQVDFAVNNVFLTGLLVVCYLILAVANANWPMPWLLLGLAVLAWEFYRLAISNALHWGETVKSAFDLYRLDLLAQLGFARPMTLSDERHVWEKLNQSFLYWEKVELARQPADNRG